MADKYAAIEEEMGYPVSAIMREYDGRIGVMEPRIACRHCLLGEWIVEFGNEEYCDDVTAFANCAAYGYQSYPKFRVRACHARLKAIDAERRQDAASTEQVPKPPA